MREPRIAAVIWTGEFRKNGESWTAECVELGTATFAATLDEAREGLVEAVLLQLGEEDRLGFLMEFLRDRGVQPMNISGPGPRTSRRTTAWRSPVAAGRQLLHLVELDGRKACKLE